MRPLIGISAEVAQVSRYWGTDLHHVLDADYVAAVWAAGGLPVALPVGDPDDVAELLARLDGLVLSGGNDVDPAHYGQVRIDAGTGGELDPERDRFELALASRAIATDLPTLAICRGLQVVNVACGGTLIQHLPAHADTPSNPPARNESSNPDNPSPDTQAAGTDRHVEGPEPGGRAPAIPIGAVSHRVQLVAGSRLGARHPGLAEVNSFHHQAIDRPGTGIRVVATAPDGVVEAVEHEQAPRLVAVQWHPEMLPGRPEHAALFTRLVADATSYRQR